ncbi:MAG: PKD domain-containing protein [Vicinamibacterales bacterium]
MGLSPLRVRTVAEIRGGADDYAEFYCVSVEWDWGDGTVSENSEDCEPYVAGTSEIRRRFSAEHVYRQSGNFRVYIRLKQKSRIVAAANAQLQIRPGARDAF